MNRREIFAAIKEARGGEPWQVPEVQMLDAVLDQLGVPKEGPPRGLKDEGAFFEAIRQNGLFNGLKQSQVDGIKAKLAAFTGWPIAYAAYAMATSYWETNKTMQPVREAYWLTEEWRKKNLRYYPWYGRGDVQLTWEVNYRRADTELRLSGALIAEPEKALEPDISARVMVRGMQEGWFTGKRLSDTLPAIGEATFVQFKASRPIINGTDKAGEIAEAALKWQAAFKAGGWA